MRFYVEDRAAVLLWFSCNYLFVMSAVQQPIARFSYTIHSCFPSPINQFVKSNIIASQWRKSPKCEILSTENPPHHNNHSLESMHLSKRIAIADARIHIHKRSHICARIKTNIIAVKNVSNNVCNRLFSFQTKKKKKFNDRNKAIVTFFRLLCKCILYLILF